MKPRRGRPSRSQWMAALGLILTGLFFALPVFPDYLRDRMTSILIVPGLIVLVILWRRTEVYDDLPLEEQRERKLEDQDERNQMIYEKTSWLCWQGETVLFLAALPAIALLMDKADLLRQLSPRAISLLTLAYWARLLIFGLVHWWMDRKY